jgi:hypothetical protein
MLVDVGQIQFLAWLIHNERDRFAPAMEIPKSPLVPGTDLIRVNVAIQVREKTEVMMVCDSLVTIRCHPLKTSKHFSDKSFEARKHQNKPTFIGTSYSPSPTAASCSLAISPSAMPSAKIPCAHSAKQAMKTM